MGNENGSALIQVIIAAAIFSIISLAMSNLIVEQRQATAYLEDQLEKVQFIRNLETVLKDGLSCQKTLQGVSIPGKNKSVKIASIKDNTGTVLYKSNSITGRLKVGDIKVLNQSVLAPDSSGFVEIEVPISRTRKGGGPATFKPYKSKLSITVDSSKKATTCFNPSDLENILKTARVFEQKVCARHDGIEIIIAKCGNGYSLLSCSGGPGDMDDSYEGWHTRPDFIKNNCTMKIQKPRCVTGNLMTEQRAMAICYQNGK